MANGIDVFTAYQTVADWSAVRRAGYEFAYVKVSDGVGVRATDGYGPKGRAAGVAMGGYHYAQFGDPIRQANLLCDQVISEGLTDLAPALDLEDPFRPDATAASFAIAFLRQVKTRGFRPLIYASNSMLAAVLPTVKAAIPDVFVWVARYGGPAPTVPYDVWQWTDRGSVPGIRASAVDLNRGEIPFNRPTHLSGGGSSPASTPSNPSPHYGDQMIRVPKGGSKDHPVTFPLPVSMLREHDVVIAPGKMPVVLYDAYNWGWTGDSDRDMPGTGGNPVPGDQTKVIHVKGSYSFIVPKGTGKCDLVYWADDDFTVGVFPR